ncbi:hypothetical protein BANRA_05486 [Klebsiella variicola]|nr:hypothetical protein BANRA_05486 [Klebsiella variicola]
MSVISPGLQTLFQDAGRAGQSSMGISPSGALTRPLGGAPTGWLATLVTCPHWKLRRWVQSPYLCPNGRCANRRALPGHGHPCRRRTFYRQHRSATGTKQATSYDWERSTRVRSYRHAVAAGPLHHNWAVPHATRWHKLARNRYRLGLNCMQAPRRHTVRYSCHRPAFITGTRRDHHAGYHPWATLRLVQRRSAGPAHQPVLASHATI